MKDDNLFVGVCWSLLLWVLVATVLKLAGLCSLSWWLVLLPLWLPVVGFICLFLLCGIAYLTYWGGGSGQ